MGNKLNALKNTFIVFLFAIGAKLLSLIRESVIAAFIGTSLEADAYYMVMSIYTIFELGLSTSIYQCFFPIYKELSIKDENKDKKLDFANTIFIILLIASLILVLFEIFAGKYIIKLIAIGFNEEGIKITKKLLIISAPMLIFVVISEYFSAILRSHNIFVWSQFREWMTHILAIVSILFLYKKVGIYALGIGLVIGSIFRMLVQVPMIKKIHIFKKRINTKLKETKIFFRRVPAALITASIIEIKSISDKMVASTLTTGAISTLNYGYKLESAISGIIFNSIATGIYPSIVQLYADKRDKELSELMEKILQILYIIIIPLILISTFLGKEIVSIIYKRGAFGETEVFLTAAIFSGYMLGSIFYGSSIILSNIFYTSGDVGTLMKINVIDLIINIVLNFILSKYMGALGLALATSIASLVTFFIKIQKIQKYVTLNWAILILEILKIIFSSMLSIIFSYFILRNIYIENILLKLMFSISTMFVFYVILLFTFKVYIIVEVQKYIKDKLI